MRKPYSQLDGRLYRDLKLKNEKAVEDFINSGQIWNDTELSLKMKLELLERKQKGERLLCAGPICPNCGKMVIEDDP
jgi:hypothetical protein